MATRLYLRNTTSSYAPTSGEKSTALPAGTSNNITTKENRSLSTTIGSSQTSTTLITLAQLAVQSGLIQRHTSERLAAQTISANTWTIFQKTLESNGQANIFSAGSIYVWRPSSSTVVGFIYDSNSTLGIGFRTTDPLNEWESTSPGTVGTGTVSGSEITVQDGDVLVFEVWYRAEQGKSASYTGTFYYDGTNDTDITNGSTTNTSGAAFLETPQNLTFFTDVSIFAQFILID